MVLVSNKERTNASSPQNSANRPMNKATLLFFPANIMQPIQHSSDVPCKSRYPESPFFRALNAPFVPTPFLLDEPGARVPRVGDPATPKGLEPLTTPIYTSTGEWEWLNGQTFYDIHDLATLHDNRVHKTTIRGCRVGERTLAYMNKSWKLDARLPGIARELWLYKFPLKDLMGECVPKLIAIRAAAGTFNLGFELPHQTFFIEPSADMPEALKRRVINALHKVHAKGVCHNALSLDNILIGADGNIYFYNFHHARCVRGQPAVQLKQTKDIDFALEKRRLEFQLDYDNARKKEKDRLTAAIQRQRNNDIELRKLKMDPLYEPKLILQEQTPPLILPRFEAWVHDLDREPRRFIMPGQTVEDFEWELKRFYNILQKMEDLHRAAGLAQPQTPGSSVPTEMGPSTAEEEMVELDGEDMEVDSILASNEHHRSLKRKRSTEMEESVSSQPSVRKRFRRESTFSSCQARAQFKNEELRPGVKLVSAFEIEPSVQENNVVPQWPIVVVRDFQKQPPPEIGEALESLVKRNCDRFKEEQRREKAKCETEQKSSSSWISLWNPLRYFSWGSQDNKCEEKSQDATTIPRRGNPLRRHETLLFIPAGLSNS